jgi:hypothetical protein
MGIIYTGRHKPHEPHNLKHLTTSLPWEGIMDRRPGRPNQANESKSESDKAKDRRKEHERVGLSSSYS